MLKASVRVCVYADLHRLCSCHSNDTADALSDGLLGDDDKWRGVTRVLQMAADNRKRQHIANGVTQLWEAAVGEQRILQIIIKNSVIYLLMFPHWRKMGGHFGSDPAFPAQMILYRHIFFPPN